MVVALAAYALTRFVSLPHVSVLFLAAVVMSAAFWGFWPAVLAAVLSVGAGSFFFYSPIFDFRVADPQDVADLAVFVIVAAFTSRLAARVRSQALEARRQQQFVSKLLAFAERISGSADDAELHGAILDHLSPVIGSPAFLFVPDGGRLCTAASHPKEHAAPEEVRGIADQVSSGKQASIPGWRLERLATAQGPAGVVAARLPAPPADPEYAGALLRHAALALERSRLRREIAEARLKAQGETLREALLNAVSHDLQTPLAAILGSATALESFGAQASAAARAELVLTIREETERLAAYVHNVLDLTRIRSGPVAARLELVELADIINAALRRKEQQLRRHNVRVALPPDLPMLRLDLFLMEHALANVLDNAAKYAPPGSDLRIVAWRQDYEVILEVSDAGRGISQEDLPRVFAPFYRGAGPEGRPAPGTGLGLAICRAFVEANGGSTMIRSAGPGQGATILFQLPMPQGAPVAESATSDD